MQEHQNQYNNINYQNRNNKPEGRVETFTTKEEIEEQVNKLYGNSADDTQKENNNLKATEAQKIQIAQKQNKQRLCLVFTAEEMKKLEIAYNYKYNLLRHSKISEHIKNNIIDEIKDILEDMKQNFF